MRSGAAPHPGGTEVDPDLWWQALQLASRDAGGLEDVQAIAVAAQQHGMISLDDNDKVVRPALLWNDTRSAEAAVALQAELGREAWAAAVGSVPLAAFTVSKLRWLAEHEPSSARRTKTVCLPHDYLTWKLGGVLVTDRSDASGTGYWSPATGTYRHDLVEFALGHGAALPEVLAPAQGAGYAGAAVLGPGSGDNAAAALALGGRPGDVIVSLGTSGVISAVASTPSCDPSGCVAGFADATGNFLPLVCTLNGSRVLDAAAQLLGVDHHELSRLALSAPAGADSLVVVPYLEGERTPDLPYARGAVHGLSLATATPAHMARAAVEGMLCNLADGLDALLGQGVVTERLLLIGGGARSEAVRRIAPTIFGLPVLVPAPSEYVAEGAARQAAWVLTGELPMWPQRNVARYDAEPVPGIRERYAEVRHLTTTEP